VKIEKFLFSSTIERRPAMNQAEEEGDKTVVEQKARVPGLLAMMSLARGSGRMEFVNRDLNAAINMRRCAVLERRPPEWTRENFKGQPLKVELY